MPVRTASQPTGLCSAVLYYITEGFREVFSFLRKWDILFSRNNYLSAEVSFRVFTSSPYNLKTHIERHQKQLTTHLLSLATCTIIIFYEVIIKVIKVGCTRNWYWLDIQTRGNYLVAEGGENIFFTINILSHDIIILRIEDCRFFFFEKWFDRKWFGGAILRSSIFFIVELLSLK